MRQHDGTEDGDDRLSGHLEEALGDIEAVRQLYRSGLLSTYRTAYNRLLRRWLSCGVYNVHTERGREVQPSRYVRATEATPSPDPTNSGGPRPAEQLEETIWGIGVGGPVRMARIDVRPRLS